MGLFALLALFFSAAEELDDENAQPAVIVDKITPVRPMLPVKIMTLLPGKVGSAASSSAKPNPAPSGPLPAQALEAYAVYGRTKSKSERLRLNNLHHGGQWFRFASWSDKWDAKLAKMYFWASPTGANKVVSERKAFNLAWMAQAPDAWYPRHGARGRSVRMGALKKFIGPKADWKTLAATFKNLLKELPEVLEAAGVVGSAIGTGGASALSDPTGQIEQILDPIKGAFDAVGGLVKETKARTFAAAAIVRGLGDMYLSRLASANPHALKGGKLDLGRNYMENPRTYADLAKPGNARPLLYNPPRIKA